MTQKYVLENGCLIRYLSWAGEVRKSYIRPEDIAADFQFKKDIDYEKFWLRCRQKPHSADSRGEIRVADLFSGCGGLSLGIAEACRALEYKFFPVLAADLAPSALDLYKRNFNPLHTLSEPIETWIDSDLGSSASANEKAFIDLAGAVDILIGGPPCQGNSDLNNHTRRADPRNLLYLRMIRCVELLRPKFVIIENVPGVTHDIHNVVGVAKDKLRQLGYALDYGTIDMSTIGVPQKRKRFFLVASLGKGICFSQFVENVQTDVRPLSWAIEDLLDVEDETVFNSPANSSLTNKKRIDYLFDNDIFDLPNSERPNCHKLKRHSYTSVYGRMHWDLPSPTITGGFGSNGQGRFVHSKKRRTITPHEAARIQFFPDFFDFSGIKRRELQQIIGNAVPSKAGYTIGLGMLSNWEV